MRKKYFDFSFKDFYSIFYEEVIFAHNSTLFVL